MNEIISEYEKVSEDVQKNFGGLSAEQINWKPRADSWSIGQCLDHLIKSNEALTRSFRRFQAVRKNRHFGKNIRH